MTPAERAPGETPEPERPERRPWRDTGPPVFHGGQYRPWTSLQSVFPVFLVVAVGAGPAAVQLPGREFHRHGEPLVYYILLPSLLFTN